MKLSERVLILECLIRGIRSLRCIPLTIIVCLMIFVLSSSLPQNASGYYPEDTHHPIVNKAGTIFDQDDWWKDYHLDIGAGVVDEDNGGDVLYGCEYLEHFNSHFWDPDDPDGVWTVVEAVPTTKAVCKNNAFSKVIGLTARALQEINNGYIHEAYNFLGHIAHLLQDQSVPAHAHEEPHAEILNPDYYETKMKDADNNFLWEGGSKPSPFASSPVGLIDIPPDVCQKFFGNPDWKKMWEKEEWKNELSPEKWKGNQPCPTCSAMHYESDGSVVDPCSNTYGVGLAKIAYLLYTTNQYSDWWDDCAYVLGGAWGCESGESNLPYFPEWIDYTEYIELGYSRGDEDGDSSIIPVQGHYNYRYAMRATATLYQVFQEMAVPTLTVNSLADPGDGTCDQSECTLREAIKMAANGATIRFDDRLSGNLITLQSTLTITKPLTIDASSFSTNIVVSGNSSQGVFYINSEAVALKGIDITEGLESSGGGIYMEGGSLEVSDCAFYGNQANSAAGGGVYIANGELNVVNCTFTDNSSLAGSGGAIASDSSKSIKIYNSTFINNHAATFGGGIATTSGSLTVTNSLLNTNSADWGGGVGTTSGTSPKLTNVTFYGNLAGTGGGIYLEIAGITLENTILWGNSASTGGQLFLQTVTYTITNSIIQDGDEFGAITDDPQFLDAAHGNLRLQTDSPAIDAGRNSALPPDDFDLDDDGNYSEPISVDLDGSARISDIVGIGNDANDFIVNLGAYEGYIRYVKPVASGSGNCASWENACELQTALTNPDSNYEVWVAAGLYYPGAAGNRFATFSLKNGVSLYGGFAGWETSRDQRDWNANFTILSGDIDQNDETENDIVVDTKNILGSNAYRVVSAVGFTEAAELDGLIITGGHNDQVSFPAQWGGGLYVDSAPLVVRNVRLEGNLASAGGGMFIKEGKQLLILENVEFISNTATINGGGLHTYNGSNPILSNVTFIGNTAVEKGGGMINFIGCDPILTGVTFTDNTAYQGGGLANVFSSHPRLINVTFSSNYGLGDGGGMYNFSSGPALMNVVFFDNEAIIKGGGMANAASMPVLTNVTFYSNRAQEGGGMYSGSGEVAASFPVVTNSILWGNSGGQIVDDPATDTWVTYSDVEGSYGVPGNHNINADPLFMDASKGNLRLQFGSPAIDAGTNAAVPWDIYDLDHDGLTTTERLYFDLDRLARIVDIFGRGGDSNNFTIDMGAYEAVWFPVFLPLLTK